MLYEKFAATAVATEAIRAFIPEDITGLQSEILIERLFITKQTWMH